MVGSVFWVYETDVVQIEELVIGGVNEDWPVEDHPDSLFPSGG